MLTVHVLQCSHRRIHQTNHSLDSNREISRKMGGNCLLGQCFHFQIEFCSVSVFYVHANDVCALFREEES